MFWQIGGAADTTAPVRASAGSAPGRARAAHLGSCPGRHPAPTGRSSLSGAGPQPAGPGATEEGIALVTAARPRDPIGPHQLRAAIAALHDEAQGPEATGWPQITALYDVLLRLDDNPAVALSHAVAISMVAGPRAGPELAQHLGTDPRVNAEPRSYAVRGHLLVRAGHPAAAPAAGPVRCAGRPGSPRTAVSHRGPGSAGTRRPAPSARSGGCLGPARSCGAGSSHANRWSAHTSRSHTLAPG